MYSSSLLSQTSEWNPFIMMINKPLHVLKDAALCLIFRLGNRSSWIVLHGFEHAVNRPTTPERQG